MLIQPPERLASYSNGQAKIITRMVHGCPSPGLPGFAARPATLCGGFASRWGRRPAGEDGRGQAAARREFSSHHAPFWLAARGDVAQDFVDGMLVKDAHGRSDKQPHM